MSEVVARVKAQGPVQAAVAGSFWHESGTSVRDCLAAMQAHLDRQTP